MANKVWWSLGPSLKRGSTVQGKKLLHFALFSLLLIGDFQYGLNMVFQSEDGLTLLARSMDANHTSMMTDVVKVMAAVCLVK